MPQRRSKYEFRQEASLSQKLAYKYPEFGDYSGSDQRISLTIALLNHLANEKKIDLKDPSWRFVKGLLMEQRKAIFATSPKTNEITKMGLMMPKGTSEVDYDAETE